MAGTNDLLNLLVLHQGKVYLRRSSIFDGSSLYSVKSGWLWLAGIDWAFFVALGLYRRETSSRVFSANLLHVFTIRSVFVFHSK